MGQNAEAGLNPGLHKGKLLGVLGEGWRFCENGRLQSELCAPLETAAKTIVFETVLFHHGWVKKIAAIEDEGPAHGFGNASPI